MFYFLKEDFDFLEKEIGNIVKKIAKLKQEKGLSTTQTSETWHDNFMFEDSERQINIYLHRLEELIKLKENIKIIEPSKNNNKVSIGLIIVIKDQNGKIKTLKIGSYMIFNNDKNAISYKSPIASALLNAKIGKIVKVKIGDNEKTFEILEIKN